VSSIYSGTREKPAWRAQHQHTRNQSKSQLSVVDEFEMQRTSLPNPGLATFAGDNGTLCDYHRRDSLQGLSPCKKQ
jgi:hypothetical protein